MWSALDLKAQSACALDFYQRRNYKYNIKWDQIRIYWVIFYSLSLFLRNLISPCNSFISSSFGSSSSFTTGLMLINLVLCANFKVPENRQFKKYSLWWCTRYVEISYLRILHNYYQRETNMLPLKSLNFLPENPENRQFKKIQFVMGHPVFWSLSEVPLIKRNPENRL